MKNLKLPIWLLAIGMAFTFIFNSCTKDSISPEGVDDLSAITAQAKNINADITVLPSGDMTGATDVATIETALNSLVAGDVLLLESGTFYINREILISDFSGTMIGRGADETEIVGVGDNITPFDFGSFFSFIEPAGGLDVSHMSFTLPDGFTTTTSDGNLWAFIFVQLTTDGSDTTFDHLRLTGTDAVIGSPIFLGSQPINGIVVQGDFTVFPTFSSSGHHIVTNSEFSEQGIQSLQYAGFNGASIGVHNNSFTEIKQTIYRFMSGSSVSITNNDMDTFSFGAIVVTQEGVPVTGDPNAVHIRNNTVQTAGFMPVEIGAVPGGAANFDLLIEKNNLTNLGFEPLGFLPVLSGIGIGEGNDGAIVRNNKVEGQADFGILNESNDCTFQGNNTQGFTPIVAHYGLFGDNNTIIGGGNSTVLDLGVGNVVTGMSNVTGESIGERMQAAQEKRKEILAAFDNY